MKPHICHYCPPWSTLLDPEKRIIAKADFVIGFIRPDNIPELRQLAGPHMVRVAWPLEMQTTRLWDGNPSAWWLPDARTWSMDRAMQVACCQTVTGNDWLLRDTHGDIIPAGRDLFYVNWTGACPKGIRGEYRGFTAAQWAARKLAQFSLAWTWESMTSFNAVMFEILYDCMGSISGQRLVHADPNRDGVAEGVSHLCGSGGSNERLSTLMRLENGIFWRDFKAYRRPDLMTFINDNTADMGPAWRGECDGTKLENWLRGRGDWTYWMYEGDPHYRGDQDIVYVLWDPRQDAAENRRRMRLGLGSSLLAPVPGYLAWAKDRDGCEIGLWDPLFDMELGEITSMAAEKISYGEHGALYRRYFSRCTVTVNPGREAIGDCPAGDATFERR